MENEDLDTEVEELEPIEEIPEGEEDTTDYKALALKNHGIAQRLKTRLAKLSEKPKEATPVAKEEKQGLDYAELAYLSAKGVNDEDVPFVEKTLKDTGKSLKDLMGAKWFQAELKEKEDERKTKEAIPTGTKRPAQSDKTEKDYWVTKIREGKAKLSDIPDVKLRREVNNAGIQSASEGSKFSPQSVVIGGGN